MTYSHYNDSSRKMLSQLFYNGRSIPPDSVTGKSDLVLVL